MRCVECQALNREGVAFCEECGARFARTCPSCGSTVLPDKKFCGVCGAALRGRGDEESGRPSYTPAHLVAKILTSRSALEGERKQVTVLFCDIVGFSELGRWLDPEILHELTDRVLRIMADGVHRYEGTVNQYLGDGVMALFGAPLAVEDHAVRAIQAALAIQETIRGYSERVKQERDVEIKLRIGLNSGLVIVGRIGDDLRMDYTAVGDTTNLAARVQATAEPGTIFITDATRRLAEGYIQCETMGTFRLKGRSEPEVLFRVTGRRRVGSRLEAKTERGFTKLVGRDAQLSVLRERLERAKTGLGQVVGIVGEPGVGKSRLVYEFRRSIAGDRVVWLQGHCVSYGQGTPFLPIVEMLRTNFHVEEGDNPLQVDEKLRVRLHQVDPELLSTLPFLSELLAPGDRKAGGNLEPKEWGQKTFEAIRALTLAASRRRPHVLIVEDLHWIDKTSEDYLFRFLVEILTGGKILLITTHRPGYSVRWGDKAYYTQVALGFLDEREAEEMLTSVLGTRELPSKVSRVVWEKTEGNPLFIEEFTRSLHEDGALVDVDGQWRLSDRAVIELPGTVQDVIRARIDRLTDPVKRTLLAAAVVGREFSVRLLERVSLASTEVKDHLEELKRLELIQEKRVFPEVEYAFNHAVTRDVAYEGLLLHRRKELHELIGRALEELHVDRLEEQAAILAYHYARSERPEKAVQYLLLAGDRAAQLYANTEATSYFEQALVIAQSLPASAALQRMEVDASVKLAAVGTTRQDVERDKERLERVRRVAAELNDDERTAKVLYWLGRTHYVLWNPDTVLEYAQQSLQLAERLGDDALAAGPVNLMGRVYLVTSEFVKASEMLQRSVEQMHKLGNKTEEATAAGLAGTMLSILGEFERALAYADRGTELAGEIRNPFAEAAAWYYRGTVLDQRGEWSDAIADYSRSVQLAEAAGDLFRVYIVKAWQGRAQALAGNATAGRKLIEDSLAIAERIGTKFWLSSQKTWLAECLLELGELEAAAELSREAIRLAEAATDKFNVALAHRILGEALWRAGALGQETAEQALLEAIRIQEAIGARPELGRSYVKYARFLQRHGATRKAGEHLSRAIEMFSTMGMRADRGRAEEEMRDYGVSRN